MTIQLFATYSETGSSVSKTLLLVIEDDSLLRKSLVELLKLKGFCTVEAGDGQTGLELAQSLQPDCVLLDLRLPDIDGFAVLRRMKKYELTAHIPVVVLSGSNRLEDQGHAVKLGAATYIVKPFHSDGLVASIRRVLE